ncbi:MAG: hypothetical protein Q8P41_30020 [Pseudomonadota bacterium]|nr:hypothetical protein [Pseudomonadota bacterium]
MNPPVLVRPMDIGQFVRSVLLHPARCIQPATMGRLHAELRASVHARDVPLFVRRSGTAGPESKRAVTLDDAPTGRSIVFTDNSPAVWLYHIGLGLLPGPGPATIRTLLRERRLPMAHRLQPAERERALEWPLLRAACGVYPQLWTAGWKVSHILPCSARVHDRSQAFLAQLATSDRVAYLCMRTLRNASPFNLFLSPKPTQYIGLLDGQPATRNDLGEDQRIIDWVVHVLHDERLAGDREVQRAFRSYLLEAGGIEVPAPSDLSRAAVSLALKPVVRGTLPSRLPASGDSSGPRVFQVNQNNTTETSAGILCAPDDRRAGHGLLRSLRPGDILFHYNSKERRTHAVSVVEPMNESDVRLDPWRPLERIRTRGACFLAYSGRHLTQDQPSERTEFLLAFSRTCRTGMVLPNAFPGQQIYLKEMVGIEGPHREVLEALGRAFVDDDAVD